MKIKSVTIVAAVQFALLAGICSDPARMYAGSMGPNQGAYPVFDLYHDFPDYIQGDQQQRAIQGIGPDDDIYVKIYVHNTVNLQLWQCSVNFLKDYLQPMPVGDTPDSVLFSLSGERHILHKNVDPTVQLTTVFNVHDFQGSNSEEKKLTAGAFVISFTEEQAPDGSGLLAVFHLRTSHGMTNSTELLLTFQDVSFGDNNAVRDDITAGLINGVITEVPSLNEMALQALFPAHYALLQNYPNPFNPSTIIRYRVAEPGMVSLKIFNGLGQTVRMPVQEYQQAGEYGVHVTMDNLASGIYFYQLTVNGYVKTRRMLFLK